MTTEHGRRDPTLTRHEAAQVEVGRTTVTPATAWVLVCLFAAALALAPALESAGRVWRAGDEAFASAWSHLAGLPADLGAAWTLAGSTPGAGAWNRIVAANRAALAALDAFETGLEDESAIARALRPPAQGLLSGWLGAGNERVYVGRDGWLFYRPDVEYVTGPGFLAPSALARRVAAASEWASPPQPDPRVAIRRFHEQLAARGIALVVMPTPLKPMLQPERLAGRAGGWPVPPDNPSFTDFVDDLRLAGVLVFDASAAMIDGRTRDSGPLYLATDSHWRPDAMAVVARELAAFLETHVGLPPAPDPGYRTDALEWRSTGDLTRMLDLPEAQTLFGPETVTIRRTLDSGGAPWRPIRTADVLVLGDSFSNIYSLASLGWGDSAGLVEQLGVALKRPVDRIVQNDDGAFATRAMLTRDLAAGADRLARTRVVVYQFAVRELAVGDWRLIDLPPGPRRASPGTRVFGP